MSCTDLAFAMSKGPALWSWGALCDDVKFLYSGTHAAHVEASASTIRRRLRHCRYHFAETRRLVGADLETRDSDAVLADFILPVDDTVYDEFHERRADAEAHLVALLQGVHAIPDPLAHVIYFSLGLDQPPARPLKDRAITLPTVLARVTAGRLAQAIQRMLAEPALRHLSAAVNLGKHRSLLKVPVSVDFTGLRTKPHGLLFSSFKYDGEFFPEQEVESFSKALF